MSLVTLRRRIGDLKPSFDDILSSDYRNHPRYRGVVGHWIMNESGGLTAYDISGNGNHGTLTSGPVWTQGQFGPALSFDGVNDYVRINNINTNLPFTFSSWVRWNTMSDSTSGRIFAVDANEWILDTNDEFEGLRFYNGSTITATSLNLVGGIWYHIIAIANGANSKIYVNGVEKGSGDLGAASLAAANFDIGATGAPFNQNPHNGQIDDARIYNRALGPDEVMSLYTDSFLEFRELDVYRWVRIPRGIIVPILTTPPFYRPTVIGARTI